MADINALVKARKDQLVNCLPDYAYRYDEGDRYVAREFSEPIERELQQYKTELMEERRRHLGEELRQKETELQEAKEQLRLAREEQQVLAAKKAAEQDKEEQQVLQT